MGMEERIVDVWQENLEQEISKIQEIVDQYPFISMDTEFPGVVAKPMGTFRTTAEYNYQALRSNVDLLKLIQLGLTFSDEHGNLCPGTCTWQFNFKFNLGVDMYSQSSIELLSNSGVDFDKLSQHGINYAAFGEALMMSGVVLNENVHWVTFHSGYDFAYLLKVLTCSSLPTTDSEFAELLQLYFHNKYDIKFIVKDIEHLKGGLQKIADDLQLERFGTMHTAGSDSLLTHQAFFKIKQDFNHVDTGKYSGILYGLGAGCMANEHTTGY